MDEFVQVEVVRHDGVVRARLVGELDLASGPRAAKAIDEVLRDAEADTIVVDLGELSFCDASGLNVFVSAHRAAAAVGKTIVLANPSPIVRRVFETVQFERVVTVDTGSGGARDWSSGGSDVSESN